MTQESDGLAPESGEELERAILALLARRRTGATICPSEAARAVDPAGWREHMDEARSAAARLAARGAIEVTQGGRPVDPRRARGPIRLRRAAVRADGA